MGFSIDVQGGEKPFHQKWIPFCIVWTIGCLIIWGCTLWITIMTKRKIYNELVLQGNLGSDIALAYQLVEDWKMQPLVALEVVEGGEDCPTTFEPVFYKEWKGTEPGCWTEDGACCGSSKDGCNCEVDYGAGFAETEFEHSIGEGYNSTHYSPFGHGIGGMRKKRGPCLEIDPLDPID